MPSKLRQLNIRLPDESWERIDRLTAALGLSQADVVRLGLRLLERRELTEKKIRKNPESGVDSV